MSTQVAAEVAVVDYGLGNLRSATRGLERAGARVTLTDDPEAIVTVGIGGSALGSATVDAALGGGSEAPPAPAEAGPADQPRGDHLARDEERVDEDRQHVLAGRGQVRDVELGRLGGEDLGGHDNQPYADTNRLGTAAMARQWQNFMGAISYPIALQQFNQLDSHDTTRILYVVDDDKALMKLGAALMFGFPGVPCVYYAASKTRLIGAVCPGMNPNGTRRYRITSGS